MCGITGIMTLSAAVPDKTLLERMIGVIRHRGPDDVSYWSGPHMGLGFCRLSIVDLAEGRQPISNEDGSLWLVFNGEIYNYQSLRGKLQDRGHLFSTESDSEIIVHLYEEYGEGCVHHLRGMFSFAIWDSRKQMLFAARDPFGIKPFYYRSSGDSFMFASEIKSLLAASGQAASVKPESLLNFLTFQYVPEPTTMFTGISKLQPGHYLIARPGESLKLKKYWEPSFTPEDRPLSYYTEQIEARLADSVSRHLTGDVEVGCFLSSGIDSTAIAALLRRHRNVRTFSVGFEGPHNETTFAAETARTLGTEHYDMLISEEDYFQSVPRAVWHQDEPVADPSAIALYHVAKLASSKVKVVLSGEGADELFGGYGIYREPAALAPFSLLPNWARQLLKNLAVRLPSGMKGRNYILRASTPLEERFLGNAKIFSEDMKAQLVKSFADLEENFQTPQQIAGRYYAQTVHLDPVTRMQHIDMNLWLPGNILMKADKMTMAHSLELRVPFLDLEVFELAAKLPSAFKTAKGTTKYALRQALSGVVPESVVNRPKLGFPVPLRQWLAAGRGGRVLEQIENAGISDYVHLDQVAAMYKLHREGSGDYSRRLWALYIFALWHTAFIKEGPSASFQPTPDREQIVPGWSPSVLPIDIIQT
ncbi:asparagine synthase (glutamine-hydrolyzing) [Paenibacillus sp. GCM10012307]|uniref:asparagine synthase (glutamine-hydrolyzing) n=1 Tax=Paenibacillus roseus TaxID=2798579 RepID=A0A934J1Z0_9BACL|nr:asparagine synthase (glutamine-hydrolyzing) [Paenibacillus roseus]MBJ6359988.1 asparagine synthase (glutamine-hydrolyzing) [Paenibacillus roseus]